VLSMCGECPCVLPAVAYLREVINYGPLESLRFHNHFLMYSSLSRCWCWCGLTGYRPDRTLYMLSSKIENAR